jgi:hypothetical protein
MLNLQACRGLARRLDCVSEIQALAARWQNCLRDYIPSLNSGRCAIYVWDNEATRGMFGQAPWSARLVLG